MKTLYPILFVLILFTSCKPKEISITLLFDKPIKEAKYPLYFKELTVPFEKDCQSEKVEYLLKPINISRLDISNKEVETNAWYFKDIGDNTVEFSTGWLEHYFKDSLINPYLTQPSAKEFLFDNWLANSKDSLYILSEESDINEYKGKKVFNNTKELYAKIQESACANTSGKILVVVNPTFLKKRKLDLVIVYPPHKKKGTSKKKHDSDETESYEDISTKNSIDKKTVEGMKKGIMNGNDVQPKKLQL
jgi:hypothetical protein